MFILYLMQWDTILYPEFKTAADHWSMMATQCQSMTTSQVADFSLLNNLPGKSEF